SLSNAALRNAKRLVEDAQILLAAKRWPTAVSLAVLAIEEAAKAEMVRLIVSASTPETLQQAWRTFRSHEFKQTRVIELVRKVAERRPELITPEDGPIERAMSLFKERGFYVDMDPVGHDWHEPGEFSEQTEEEQEASELMVQLAAMIVASSR